MNRKDTVKWFSGRMLNKLDANTYKKHWRFIHQGDLLSNLEAQENYLSKECRVGGSRTEVIHRCINIANYAMMIADNERRFLEK